MSDPAHDDDELDNDDEPFTDEDADFAQEHARLTVDDFPLDRPAESDATP